MDTPPGRVARDRAPQGLLRYVTVRGVSARAILFVSAMVVAAACGREPLEWACPEVDYGDLVLTEIRGPQTGSDDEDWFEIHNATDRDIELYGTQFFIRRLNGDNPRTIVVRETGIFIGPGEYAVLGQVFPGEEPAYIKYGYANDFPVGLYDTAAIDILACGEQIDQVTYRGLTRAGSLAFDGARDPDADLTSDESLWCNDVELQVGSGLVGTPGERNRACPE